MEHIKLIEQLQIREKELIKELNAIKTLIGVYTNNQENIIENTEKITALGNMEEIKSKGKMSWEHYAVYLLRKIGGKAKASEVTDLAIKVNPDIDKNTIKSAIRSKLSIKYREGFITAEKGDYKRDGYIYILDPEKKIRTK